LSILVDDFQIEEKTRIESWHRPLADEPPVRLALGKTPMPPPSIRVFKYYPAGAV
jgi:hypothetical protein